MTRTSSITSDMESDAAKEQQLQLLIDSEFKTSPMFFYLQTTLMIITSVLFIGLFIFLYKQEYNFDISPLGWIAYAILLGVNTLLFYLFKQKPNSYYIDLIKKIIKQDDADSVSSELNDFGQSILCAAFGSLVMYAFYVILSRYEYQDVFSLRLSTIVSYTMVMYILVIYGITIDLTMHAKCIKIYNQFKSTNINPHKTWRNVVIFITTLILISYITVLGINYNTFTIKSLDTFKIDLAAKIEARDKKINENINIFNLRLQYGECQAKKCAILQDLRTQLGSSARMELADLDPKDSIAIQEGLNSILKAAEKDKLATFIGTQLTVAIPGSTSKLMLHITEEGPVIRNENGFDVYYKMTAKK